MRSAIVLRKVHQANEALKELTYKEKELALELLAMTYRKEASIEDKAIKQFSSPEPAATDTENDKHFLKRALYEIGQLKKDLPSVEEGGREDIYLRITRVEKLLGS